MKGQKRFHFSHLAFSDMEGGKGGVCGVSNRIENLEDWSQRQALEKSYQ